MKLSISQLRTFVQCLRNSNRWFYVTYRTAGGDQTFRSRFWSAPSPLPADPTGSIVFYEVPDGNASGSFRTIAETDIVSIKAGGCVYELTADAQ